jgi:hypothetical protein
MEKKNVNRLEPDTGHGCLKSVKPALGGKAPAPKSTTGSSLAIRARCRYIFLAGCRGKPAWLKQNRMSSNIELSSFAAHLRGTIVASARKPSAGVPAFDQLALELFALQFQRNPAYRRLCEARGVRPDTVAHWTAIPAVPASAFREFELSCLPVAERTAVFYSSGTTAQRPSRHYHNAESLALYETSLLAWFQANLPLVMSNWKLAILTPSPAEAPHSSLVHMFETIRHQFGPGASPFFGKAAADGAWTLNLEAAVGSLRSASAGGQPLLVLGTAFSYVHLLDNLAERDLRLKLPPGSCALETGGYKGRSRSLPKSTLHALISQRLGIPPDRIICEYGMSELSSQAYDLEVGDLATESLAFDISDVPFPLTPALSLRERENHLPCCKKREPFEFAQTRAKQLPLPQGEGWGEGEQSVVFANAPESSPRTFRFPSWARIQIISPETGREVGEGETGLIRVLDLANVYSVMALQTEDLGIRRGDGFTLAGRAVSAEPRGCSLQAA